MPEDLINEVIPLDKLISRLRTDLKLSKNYADINAKYHYMNCKWNHN